MKSFLLPTPLLDPSRWPQTTSDEIWLLPLDVATAAGGKLKGRLLELARTQQNYWYLPAAFLREGSDLAQGLRQDAVLAWLKLSGAKLTEGARVFTDDPLLIENKLHLRHVRRATVAAPGAFDWAKEIFPSFVSIAGELRLRELLQAYEKEVSDLAAFPWENLRFFAGFLRQKTVTAAASAALDWARFQALYSPQDEVAEEQSLSISAVILNPTVQFHRGEKELIAIGRYKDVQIETRLNWRDALLLDEIMEAPRSLAETIVKTCETTHGSREGEMKPVFDQLVRSHIVLQGSDENSRTP